MACPEYIRLRQHYEAALRHWGHVLLSPVAEPIGAALMKAHEVWPLASGVHPLLDRPVGAFARSTAAVRAAVA